MSERVKYEGAEKRYYVSKPKKRLKYGAWFSILVLPAIIFIILGFFLTKDAITVDDENKVTYNELGKVDYKVYLKENDYYDKPFLDKGMQYIASLIRSINVKFNYEIHTTEELDYHYAYDISANLVVTDKNDPTKVLYERPEVLLNNKTVDITDNNFVINEEIKCNILNLYFKDNKTMKEIEQTTGISRNSISKILHQDKRFLEEKDKRRESK